MPQQSTCRSCGAPVVWVTMQGTGKRMPLNAEPQHLVVVHTRSDRELIGAVRECYLSHFATCPNANSHRKRHA